MQPTREIFPRPQTQHPMLDGQVLLRDGRPAYLRVAREEDLPALEALLNRSSNVSLGFRFFGASKRGGALARLLIDTSSGTKAGGRFQGVSVVVSVGEREHERIAGVASVVPCSPHEAEIAFLVEDEFQGKGLGTLMLERLSFAAEAAGIHRLTAMVMADNEKMLHVFRDCGYQMVREVDHGEVQIAFEIVPSAESNLRAEMRDKLATQASLVPFFKPKSVAVIGASRNEASIGGRVLANILRAGFQGPVYPINPKADEVQGIKAYPNVASIPKTDGTGVDLAVLAVPPGAVFDIVDDCASRGVRAIILLTAGFAETGPEGRELQDRLLDKVRGHGMRMVGPNCLGLLNTDPAVRLNATFAPQPVARGRLAMSSQSGALGLAILNCADEYDIGFSSFVSVGNKADVSGNDLLQYWEDDPETGLILLYLESFGNPRRFARLAPRVGRRKPILAVKSGRTEAGRQAAGSHTAALAMNDAGVEALFRQAGVIRTDTLEETFEAAALLAHQPLPKGPRVGIVTNAGGLAILCADACEARGLKLAELDASTMEAMQALLPETASVKNPIDMIASAGAKQYEAILPLLLDDANIDAVIAIYIPAGMGSGDEILAALRRGRAGAKSGRTKPLMLSFMDSSGLSGTPEREAGAREGAVGTGREAGREADGGAGREDGREAGPGDGAEDERFPDYRFPESAARALARAVQYSKWMARPRGVIPFQEGIDLERIAEICERALEQRGEGWLAPGEIDELLRAAGIRTCPMQICETAEAAVHAAKGLGYPVVMKLASTTLIHKSDWQAVKLDLESDDAVRRAFGEIRDKLREAGRLDEMQGVMIQPMMPSAPEVMIGVTHDPAFGPLLAFGLGGVAVEVLRDVVFSITPITDQDAIEMIRGIRGFPLLNGHRGAPKADLESLVDLLLRISRIVEEVPLIQEMEFNPVRAYEAGRGGIVLDARVKVKPSK